METLGRKPKMAKGDKSKVHRLETPGEIVRALSIADGLRGLARRLISDAPAYQEPKARQEPKTAQTVMFNYDQGGFDDDDLGDDYALGDNGDIDAPPRVGAAEWHWLRDLPGLSIERGAASHGTASHGARGKKEWGKTEWRSYRGGEPTNGPALARRARKDAIPPRKGLQRRTWGDVAGSAKGRLDCFEGDFWFLSNFYQRAFLMDGLAYRSGEHAYQAMKMTTDSDRDLVRAALHPDTAKQIARTLPIRPRWDEFRVQAMSGMLMAKFGDPAMKSMLLKTGKWHLVEGTDGWGDTFWGEAHGVGLNHLGKELMAIRNVLKEDGDDLR